MAVLFQAIVFGIGHLYEGVGQVARITLFGVLFGLLALWRKSLRPGMVAHAWSDIFGVIIFRGVYIMAALQFCKPIGFESARVFYAFVWEG